MEQGMRWMDKIRRGMNKNEVDGQSRNEQE